MRKDTIPYCLHDLKGRPQYIAFGQYNSLLREIVFLSGWRGYFEKIWLKVQQLYPRSILKDRVSLQHWNTLSQSLAAPVKAALFWQTNWYKTTQFIGGISTDDRQFFIKAYKHADDAVLAKQQSDFINHYFGSDFTIVPVMSINDRTVFYPLMSHASKHVTPKDIEKRLIALNKAHAERFSRALKPALDYINLNLPNLLQKTGYIDLWKSVHQRLSTAKQLPMVPVHGDVTPWNVFYSEKLSPVLVDYERAGWHVPFYDCWHFYCQPLILQKKKPDLNRYIKILHTQTGSDLGFLQYTALLYLLDQLAYDLQDQQDYPQQQTRLGTVIMLKIRLIQNLLDDFSTL
jgi:hypothetical protein